MLLRAPLITATRLKSAWNADHVDPADEVEFSQFMKMLDKVDIFLCEAQAMRIFKAVDVDGSGEMGLSEFENFLMAFDVLGQAGADLAALDIYESLKMVPSEEFGEFSSHEGLDLSGFMEAAEMLGCARAWRRKICYALSAMGERRTWISYT